MRLIRLTLGFALLVTWACVTPSPTAPDRPPIGGADCSRFPAQASSLHVMPYPHFDVVERRCAAAWPEGPYSDACHQTMPVTFRNTRAHACGPAAGVAYAALPQ